MVEKQVHDKREGGSLERGRMLEKESLEQRFKRKSEFQIHKITLF